MSASLEAVVAALRVSLEEAQKSNAAHWKPEAANRWIAQLPGAWTGRWRRLRLGGDSVGSVERTQFVAHVRAVIAYLEARMNPPASRTWWRAQRRGTPPTKLGPAAPAPVQGSRQVNLLRVRKPLPGVH